MRVVLLGTGFSIPTPSRVQTGILVDTNNNLYLLDCGSGVLSRIIQSGYSPKDITHIFFTHHHLDHNSDFLAILKANYLMGRNDMRVIGPTGTVKWIEMQLKSYPYLQGRFELDTKELQSMDVFNIGRDEIRVATTSHLEPSLAYRIDSKSSSVIFSGDTEPCEGIKKLIGDNVGVLIHECSSISKVSGHTNPKTLARFIKGLPVYKLILTHFSPEVESNMENIKDIVSTAFNGEIIFAEDLMKLEV